MRVIPPPHPALSREGERKCGFPPSKLRGTIEIQSLPKINLSIHAHRLKNLSGLSILLVMPVRSKETVILVSRGLFVWLRVRMTAQHLGW